MKRIGFLFALLALLVCWVPVVKADNYVRTDGCEGKNEAGEAVCVIPKADIEALIENNNKGWEYAVKFRQKLKEVEESAPKRATVEVVPGVKKQVPLKKERDS